MASLLYATHLYPQVYRVIGQNFHIKGFICKPPFAIKQVNRVEPGRVGSGTPRPKTISARDFSARTFRPIFQSGTARPTLVGLLGPFFYFLFIFFFSFFFLGGGGNLLFYSVYVHQNKIQETIFNVILIFRQGNREII